MNLLFTPSTLDCGNGQGASYSVMTLSSDSPQRIPPEALELASSAITVSAKVDAPFKVAGISSERGDPTRDDVGPTERPGSGVVASGGGHTIATPTAPVRPVWSYDWTQEASQAGGGSLVLPALSARPKATPPCSAVSLSASRCRCRSRPTTLGRNSPPTSSSPSASPGSRTRS